MNTFTGWPADAPALLAGIAADNRAERWDAHHEDALRAPVRALVADLHDEFGPVRVLRARVNRRFRPSAPPLRTDAGAIAGPSGGPVRAVVLSATALTVTAGIHRFDAGQVRRYRAALGVDIPPDRAGPTTGGTGPGEPGDALARLLLELGLAGLVPDPAGEMRGRPRRMPADHPRLPLLRRRGLQVTRAWPVGPWLATPAPLERARSAWRAAGPLLAWLDAHVGPADPVPRPRPGG
jgi:Conserved hypothetical protein (DUF2461)